LKNAPEVEFLKCIARPKITDNIASKIYQLLDINLNWDVIFKLSLKHRITPLLYYHLHTSINDINIPKNLIYNFKNEYETNLVRNKSLYKELYNLIDKFNTYDIDVLVLKGPVLSKLVYPSLGVRCMHDIDIIIKEDDWDKVKDLFFASGYRLPDTLPELTSKDIARYVQYFRQIEFFRDKCIPVEIHFRLFNMGILKSEQWLWQNTSVLESIKIPSPEILLLHLCIHANTHNFCSLMLFCDIGAVIDKYKDTFNMDVIHKVVNTRKINNSIYHTLKFTSELLNIPIPDKLIKPLQPSIIKQKVFEIVWNKQAILKVKKQERPSYLEAPIFYLLEMDSLLDRIIYLLKILFPPVKWLAAYFHKKSVLMQYPVYLLKYLFGYGRK
jgi:hypothetical protein